MTILQTISGRYVDLADMRPADVKIEDISHALSMLCRFNGHCREFYSVAQHSVLVSHILRDEGHAPAVQLAGLLHDAHEAYTGDVTHPMKQFAWRMWRGSDLVSVHSSLSVFQDEIKMVIEEALAPNLCAQFSDAHEYVKAADLRALATERRDLMTEQALVWPVLEGIEPAGMEIVPIGPSLAYSIFVSRFRKLAAA